MKIQQVQDLIVFFVVMRTQSLERTTQLLGVHRTTVARGIQKLEKFIGLELIDFSNGRPVPTIHARELYLTYIYLADRYYDLVTGEISQGERERVVVMAPANGLSQFIPYFTKHYNIDAYGIQLKMIAYMIQDVLTKPEMIRDELLRVDIAFMPSDFPLGAIANEFRLAKKVLIPLVLVTTPEYVKLHNITSENYPEHIKCVMSELVDNANILHRNLSKAMPTILVEGAEMVRSHVLAHGTVSFCPEYVIKEEIQSGKLIRILPHVSIFREMMLIYRYHRHPKVRQISADFGQVLDHFLVASGENNHEVR